MLPALAIIAASAGAKYLGDRAVLKRQKSIRNSMEAYQRSKTAENEAAVERLLAKQTPDARGAELAQVTADNAKSMQDTVGAAQAFNQPGIAGNVSHEYKAAQEAEAANIAERTRRAIEQLATMGAPSEQQNKFNIRFGRSAGKVDAANRASDYVGRAYMSDIEGVRPNAILDMASQVGMGVGTGMLAGGFGGGAKVPSATPTDAGSAPIGPFAGVAPRLKRGFSLWGQA